MGRNTAIKRFDPASGTTVPLLDDREGRLPVVVELLRSPWVHRASELAKHDGSCATRRAEEPVDVTWDAHRIRPLEFRRSGRSYRIDAIVQMWATERAWWDPRAHVSRRYWRVLARGGVYDLAYDRLAGTWLLVGIQD